MTNTQTAPPFTIRGVNLTKTGEIEQICSDNLTFSDLLENGKSEKFSGSAGTFKKSVSFDWVEFTASKQDGDILENTFLFDGKKMEYGSKHYNYVYEYSTILYGESVECFTIQVQPRVGFIDKNIVQIKLQNRMLYGNDMPELISNICAQLGLTFRNYTRLDVCIDHQEINGYGDNIQAAFKDFMSDKLVMKAKEMDTRSNRKFVKGIAWGSRTSECRIVWYNKSKEMEEQVYKPWIADSWKQAEFNDAKPVYRLEFSLKTPKKTNIVIDDNGQTFYDFSDMNLTADVMPLLEFVTTKHLQVGDNKNDVEDFRNMKRVYFFDLSQSVFKSVNICLREKSNNQIKSHIKRLAVDAMFYQRQKDELQSSLLFSHIQHLVDRYELGKWFNDKLYWVDLKSGFTLFDVKNNMLLKQSKLVQSSCIGINKTVDFAMYRN